MPTIPQKRGKLTTSWRKGRVGIPRRELFQRDDVADGEGGGEDGEQAGAFGGDHAAAGEGLYGPDGVLVKKETQGEGLFAVQFVAHLRLDEEAFVFRARIGHEVVEAEQPQGVAGVHAGEQIGLRVAEADENGDGDFWQIDLRTDAVRDLVVLKIAHELQADACAHVEAPIQFASEHVFRQHGRNRPAAEPGARGNFERPRELALRLKGN